MSKLILAVLGAALLLQGCAHTSTDRKIDAQMAQENTVKNPAELRSKATDLIQSNPDLTADQKSKLLGLRDSTRAKLDDMGAQSLKLRSVLIESVIAKDYDESKVEQIKKRMKKLEDQRLSTIFEAVKQANLILGRQSSVNRRLFMEDFWGMHGARD